MSDKKYRVNEIFYSLQGEGIRAGSANFFVRFTACNQTCKIETHGFDCDTEFTSGTFMTAEEIEQAILDLNKDCKNIIFTGGEPLLQLDEPLCIYFKERGYFLAIETNGSLSADGLTLDWITVSPKVAEHALRQLTASEVKYVRAKGQGIPKTKIDSYFFLISPAFKADGLRKEDLEHCIALCLENPKWSLSVQQHKIWRVR